MANVQEIVHEKKPLLGNLAYLDIRVFQDLDNKTSLPHAFGLQVDLRVLGAVVGSTGQSALANGPLSLPTPGGAALGTVNDCRGVKPDGTTSNDPNWADAKAVGFRIDGKANVTIPVFGMKVPVNVSHADFLIPIHNV